MVKGSAVTASSRRTAGLPIAHALNTRDNSKSPLQGRIPTGSTGHASAAGGHGVALAPQPEGKPVLEAERRKAARRIWARTRPAPTTVVESYLRARGLTLPIPPILRFAILRHGPTGQDLPAMVAAMQRWPDTEPVASRFTGPTWRVMAAAKLMCRSRSCPTVQIRGAAIRLGPAGETLLIAEGIETALSGQQETRIPAWAAISASNMPNIVLPELPLAGVVIIAADGDDTGADAAVRAAEVY